MLKIPKKKLYTARAMRYGGFVCFFITVIIAALFVPEERIAKWAPLFVAFGLIMFIITIIGTYRVSNLYCCPKCKSNLLKWGFRGSKIVLNNIEKTCPEYCQHCGERIVVKIIDEDER